MDPDDLIDVYEAYDDDYDEDEGLFFQEVAEKHYETEESDLEEENHNCWDTYASRETVKQVKNSVTVQLSDSDCSELMKEFQNFWKAEEFCDIEIVVENRTFHAHKNILAANSNYFKTMFTCNLLERQENRITIEDVPADVFSIILRFTYCENVEISMDVVCSVLKAANMLQFNKLQSRCEVMTAQILSPHNFFEAFELASQMNLKELKLAVASYFRLNCTQLMYTETFLSIPGTSLKAFLHNSSTLPEIDLVLSVAKWLGHDFENRIQFVSELLSKLRFNKISFSDLRRHFEEHPMDFSPTQVKLFLHEVSKSMLNVYRILHDKNIALIVSGSDYEENVVFEVLNPASREWITGSKTHSEINKGIAGAFLIGDVLHIFMNGGLLHQFSMTARSWTQSKLPSSRFKFNVAHVDESLYVIGGKFQEGEDCTFIEKFHLGEKTWEKCGFLKQRYHEPGLALYNGEIYVLTGDSWKYNEKFLTSTRKTHKFKKANFPLKSPQAVVHKKMLYVFENYRTIQKYNIRKKEWSVVEVNVEAKGPCNFVAAEIINDSLYVVCIAKRPRDWYFKIFEFSDEQLHLLCSVPAPKFLQSAVHGMHNRKPMHVKIVPGNTVQSFIMNSK